MLPAAMIIFSNPNEYVSQNFTVIDEDHFLKFPIKNMTNFYKTLKNLNIERTRVHGKS